MNSPLGIFAPGYNKLSTLFGELLTELRQNPEETGCELPSLARLEPKRSLTLTRVTQS